jgi:hypothetical protein
MFNYERINKKSLNAADSPEKMGSHNLNINHKNLVSQTVKTKSVNMQFLTQSNATGIFILLIIMILIY